MSRLMLLLFIFSFFCSCDSADIITTKKPVRDGETVESEGGIFALGFFSPGSSKSRYVGIWYARVSERTVVWVANRDNPIDDTSGSIEINRRGNIAIYRNNGTVQVWLSKISDRGTKASVAQLRDSGNLLLFDNVTGNVLWQSFDYPTDCVLPFMKLGLTRKNSLNRLLTSWKSPDDPGTGNFSLKVYADGFPQIFFFDDLSPRWRLGTWSGKALNGIPEMKANNIFNFTFINNDNEVSAMYGLIENSMLLNIMINETGLHQRHMWIHQDQGWNYWSAPREQCDNYSRCGQNGYCGSVGSNNFECTCLPSFEPKSPDESFSGEGSRGCVRKHGALGPTCGNGEGFVRLERMKVPDTLETQVEMNLGLRECEENCLRNCSCVAYASANYESGNEGLGCLMWHGDLLDMRTYPSTGQDFYVRVDAAELDRWKKHDSAGKKRITLIVIGSVGAALFTAAFAVCFIRRKREDSKSNNNISLTFTSDATYFENSLDGQELDETRRNRDLPFLPLSTVMAATNNFSLDNKLGHGGFGSVYKGVLYNGREIAVKRLSRYSGQGIEEFKNEIMLIAKLQHRNLVKILGYCIERDEKILIYEYLPNKSLDSFLFDETKKIQLDWTKRFEIIFGIARGVLYLHQDSRLRIIHRDLKASNVLLDAAMIPKISDFGMARIFIRDEMEGNTNRVVGTYGYMSPEYAMDGKFSIKSDVYSFGVLLIEILTGRRNSSFYDESSSSNLVGHVWKLWREDRTRDIIDPLLDETRPFDEILRCIQIGLLCVQESASDRPNMCSVVFMLGNTTIELPTPKHPAFIVRRNINNSWSVVWSNEEASSSAIEVTLTEIHAR